MATLSTNIHLDSANIAMRAGHAITSFFAAIGNALVNMSEKDRRVQAFNALMAKSDADLARIGLKREDIGRHVFGDLFYV